MANKWDGCELCELCKTRTNIIGYSGEIPCDILVVGDAPSKGDDRLAQPFTGAKGLVMAEWMEKAAEAAGTEPRVSYTHLVGCLPLVDGEKKNPSMEQVIACRERLESIFAISQPKGVVLVGKATKTRIKPVYSGPMISVKSPVSLSGKNSTISKLETLRAVTEIKQLLKKVM